MKKLWVLFFLSVLLLFATACNNTKEPEITINAIVAQLSNEEYDDVGKRGLDNTTKDDFRKFTFNIEIEHSEETTRKVEFPKDSSWREAIKSIDDYHRYRFGEGYKQNNENENYAKYNREFVFYSKGLNEEEIKNAFDSIGFKIYLNTEERETLEKEYKVSDLIKFNNHS